MRFRALIVGFLAICLGALTACSSAPKDLGSLTYDQIKNSGLANVCPQMNDTASGSIAVSGGSYVLTDLCLQPTGYAVKEESSNPRKLSEFVPTKSLVGAMTSLERISGSLDTSSGGVTFTEKDGYDFQPITVQLPGGDRVPFLFTVKSLVATADSSTIAPSTSFSGSFKVPSYRTSNFLDPRGRGLAAGYDNVVGLPAQADSFEEESIKRFDLGEGKISLNVSSVDSKTGEISGTFESIQPSDTDLGTVKPLDVKIDGIFYGRVEPADRKSVV